MLYSKKNDPVKFGYYCAAFIDILGQQESLQHFRELPRTEDEMRQFIRTVKDTFGVVSGIRDLFASFYDSYMGYKVPFPLSDMMKTDLRFQGFSDTIIIYLPLANDGEHIPMNSIYAALLACGATFLYSLAAGHPLRGGVEIGLGAEIYEGEIYGPALTESYRLESQIAKYPRIVVGKELTSYLWGHKYSKESHIHKEFAKRVSELCLSLLTQDVDGCPIVDYLGEGFIMAADYDQRDGEAFSKAYQFIVKELKKWSEQRNTQLAFRYALLKNYFAARRALWMGRLIQKESRKL